MQVSPRLPTLPVAPDAREPERANAYDESAIVRHRLMTSWLRVREETSTYRLIARRGKESGNKPSNQACHDHRWYVPEKSPAHVSSARLKDLHYGQDDEHVRQIDFVAPLPTSAQPGGAAK